MACMWNGVDRVIHSRDLLVVDPVRALPPLLWSMLKGGCFCEGVSAFKYWIFEGAEELRDQYPYIFPALGFADGMAWTLWQLLVGTVLWAWTREIRAIGYWHAATLLFSSFSYCVVVWIHAASDHVDLSNKPIVHSTTIRTI